MIIDMHIHPIFYEAVCKDKEELEFRKNAFGVFKQSPYGYDEMFAEMDYAHVDKAALLPLDVTTTEGGQIVTNDQIAVLVKDHPERFIGFASVDPHREDALEVLEHAFRDLELKGLKLNPAKQKFFPDDPIMNPIYELCIRYNRPIIFHAGLSWEFDGTIHSGSVYNVALWIEQDGKLLAQNGYHDVFYMPQHTPGHPTYMSHETGCRIYWA